MPPLIDGRYELIEVIASGGMATVWRARDTRLDRLVAVKRPHPTTPDDPRHDRMLREAKTAAAIGHPNLVTVFDAGEDENGLFMVMELVEGPTLEEVGGDLAPAEILEISARIAEALAVVHGMGIVHRDVKPANVLMSERGPQLTDFGVAFSSDMTRTTQPGTVIATPQYAAPEVLAGQKPTPESDVYSLSVMTCSLLAGQPPNLVTDTRAAGPTGDAALDELLQTAMSDDPQLRPDAATFAARLRSAAPTKPIQTADGSTIPMTTIAPPAGHVEITDEPEKPRRRWLAALVILLLGLVALALGTNNNEDPLAAEAAPTTVTPPSTTTIPTTTTTLTATTIAAEVDTVASASAVLVAIIESIHPSELKPKDSKAMIKKIEDAVNDAAAGESDKAAKKLNELVKDFDEKLDDETRPAAVAALENLANLLGVELEDSEDDG